MQRRDENWQALPRPLLPTLGGFRDRAKQARDAQVSTARKCIVHAGCPPLDASTGDTQQWRLRGHGDMQTPAHLHLAAPKRPLSRLRRREAA